MVIETSYGIQGIVKLLWLIDEFKKQDMLVFQHLRYAVEDKLESITPGGSQSLIGCESTILRYLKMVRLYAPTGEIESMKPFRGIMKVISREAFRAMSDYCNLVKPKSVVIVEPDHAE